MICETSVVPFPALPEKRITVQQQKPTTAVAKTKEAVKPTHAPKKVPIIVNEVDLKAVSGAMKEMGIAPNFKKSGSKTTIMVEEAEKSKTIDMLKTLNVEGHSYLKKGERVQRSQSKLRADRTCFSKHYEFSSFSYNQSPSRKSVP